MPDEKMHNEGSCFSRLQTGLTKLSSLQVHWWSTCGPPRFIRSHK